MPHAAFVLEPEAAVGDMLSQIDTPALLLDLDAFEANIERMATLAGKHGIALRPHAKAHKSVAIARAQLDAGAAGICCQKLSEAYPFAAAGITDILISNEFVGEKKVAMAVDLARRVKLTVCVDSSLQVHALGLAARAANVAMDVLVEIDAGQRRCGVRSEVALLDLLDCIGKYSDVLCFSGVQAFNGTAQHIEAWTERREAALRSAETVARYLRCLKTYGFDCPVVTGGGTGTAEFDVETGVYSEIQPGSYVFNDGHYGRLEWQGNNAPAHSLFVVSTVMSAAAPDQIVTDVGLKGIAVDSGLPIVISQSGTSANLMVRRVNDEHCVIESGPDALPVLDTRVLLVPSHCDPTVNLYRRFIGCRGGVVECLWDIEASGLSR
ncbi:MAG TPA: DSD1 family PLP-dependent enzyme [Rhodocyclaceae bacterium]|nr:DSD1 family PLP-dependent enzyme [Rhodocyclaceae bacterium]